MHMPVEVGDFVDFYSSLEHATNLGRIFRPQGGRAPPSWKNMPLGYHGRAGTVVVSGTPVRVRSGSAVHEGGPIEYGPSLALDFEAEVGFLVGTTSPPRRAPRRLRLPEHVFGVVLVNDWSARDIQALEYVPLGPFLGKSFMTSVSAWVVPLDSLAGARTAPPPQLPAPLPHLADSDPWALDLEMTVLLNGEEVARAPFAGDVFDPGQQLAHLTSNGSGVRAGDLFASGTVSGVGPRQAARSSSSPRTGASGSAPGWLPPPLPRGRRHGRHRGDRQVGDGRGRAPRAGRRHSCATRRLTLLSGAETPRCTGIGEEHCTLVRRLRRSV